jgi:hypothetical protein
VAGRDAYRAREALRERLGHQHCVLMAEPHCAWQPVRTAYSAGFGAFPMQARCVRERR